MPQDIPLLRNEIKAIHGRLELANRIYYDHYQPTPDEQHAVMTDDEYDALKDTLPVLRDQLAAYDSTDPLLPMVAKLLEEIGAEPTTGSWGKKLHPIPMGSLSKVKGITGIKEWFQKLRTQV